VSTSVPESLQSWSPASSTRTTSGFRMRFAGCSTIVNFRLLARIADRPPSRMSLVRCRHRCEISHVHLKSLEIVFQRLVCLFVIVSVYELVKRSVLSRQSLNSRLRDFVCLTDPRPYPRFLHLEIFPRWRLSPASSASNATMHPSRNPPSPSLRRIHPKKTSSPGPSSSPGRPPPPTTTVNTTGTSTSLKHSPMPLPEFACRPPQTASKHTWTSVPHSPTYTLNAGTLRGPLRQF